MGSALLNAAGILVLFLIFFYSLPFDIALIMVSFVMLLFLYPIPLIKDFPKKIILSLFNYITYIFLALIFLLNAFSIYFYGKVWLLLAVNFFLLLLGFLVPAFDEVTFMGGDALLKATQAFIKKTAILVKNNLPIDVYQNRPGTPSARNFTFANTYVHSDTFLRNLAVDTRKHLYITDTREIAQVVIERAHEELGLSSLSNNALTELVIKTGNLLPQNEVEQFLRSVLLKATYQERNLRLLRANREMASHLMLVYKERSLESLAKRSPDFRQWDIARQYRSADGERYFIRGDDQSTSGNFLENIDQLQNQEEYFRGMSSLVKFLKANEKGLIDVVADDMKRKPLLLEKGGRNPGEARLTLFFENNRKEEILFEAVTKGKKRGAIFSKVGEGFYNQAVEPPFSAYNKVYFVASKEVFLDCQKGGLENIEKQLLANTKKQTPLGKIEGVKIIPLEEEIQKEEKKRINKCFTGGKKV